jgi:hypothetical protein
MTAKGSAGSPGFDIGAPDELEGINLSAVPTACEGEGSPLCHFAVPGEQAQISDLIAAPKSPNSESLLGLHPEYQPDLPLQKATFGKELPHTTMALRPV